MHATSSLWAEAGGTGRACGETKHPESVFWHSLDRSRPKNSKLTVPRKKQTFSKCNYLNRPRGRMAGGGRSGRRQIRETSMRHQSRSAESRSSSSYTPTSHPIPFCLVSHHPDTGQATVYPWCHSAQASKLYIAWRISRLFARPTWTLHHGGAVTTLVHLTPPTSLPSLRYPVVDRGRSISQWPFVVLF